MHVLHLPQLFIQGISIDVFQKIEALLCPIYGEGELRQAFCRCAAIKGCIYVKFYRICESYLFRKISKYLNFILFQSCILFVLYTSIKKRKHGSAILLSWNFPCLAYQINLSESQGCSYSRSDYEVQVLLD